MASSTPSLDALGSSSKSSSSITHRWRSVKRTPRGSVSGYFSESAIAMSSASVHFMFAISCRSLRLFRDLDDHVALDYRLTAEPGVQRQPLRRVQAILLVGLHRREVVL